MLCVCFIKAIIPLLAMVVNRPCLMGSCPNFLRPIYHTMSASQAPKQGPCPMVNTDAGYSSCFFCSIVTDLHSSIVVLWSFADAVRFRTPSFTGFCPEPCPVSDVWHQSLDRVLDCFAYCLLFLILPVPIPDVWYLSTIFEIIRCPCLQDCADYS